MSKISYVNGRFLDHGEANVSIDDRGYLFADGIYEVIAFYNRKMLDEELHMQRLERSLKGIEIPMPMSRQALKLVISELFERNSRTHGLLYVQINRGVAKRDHVFSRSMQPSMIMTLSGPKFPKASDVQNGVSVITMPDIRWQRCSIKSISLLPNILARQASYEKGARESWLINRDGYITEGSASNSYIVTQKNMLVTHPMSDGILGGITRDVVLQLARKSKIKVEERAFTLKEALAAKEAFITSTSANVLPVIQIDGKKVGSGKPGPITQQLLGLYLAHIKKQTGYDY